MSTQTVVAVDLVGYSRLARILDETLGSRGVLQLNEQLEGMLARALERAGVSQDETRYQGTGDGALVLFDDAWTAMEFACAAQQEFGAFTAEREDPQGWRLVRVGVATGAVDVSQRDSGEWVMGGMPLIRAVRLESAALPGSVLLDSATWEACQERIASDPEALAARPLVPVSELLESDALQIAGKRDETYTAHPLQILDRAPAQAEQLEQLAEPRAATIVLRMERDSLDEGEQTELLADLAEVLAIRRDSVSIQDIERGSIRARIHFSSSSDETRFLRKLLEKDPGLSELLQAHRATRIDVDDEQFELRPAAPVMRSGDESAPATLPARERRRLILKLLSKLSEGDLKRLMYLLNMPKELRPSEKQNLEERRLEFLEWAECALPLDELLDELERMLED